MNGRHRSIVMISPLNVGATEFFRYKKCSPSLDWNSPSDCTDLSLSFKVPRPFSTHVPLALSKRWSLQNTYKNSNNWVEKFWRGIPTPLNKQRAIFAEFATWMIPGKTMSTFLQQPNAVDSTDGQKYWQSVEFDFLECTHLKNIALAFFSCYLFNLLHVCLILCLLLVFIRILS